MRQSKKSKHFVIKTNQNSPVARRRKQFSINTASTKSFDIKMIRNGRELKKKKSIFTTGQHTEEDEQERSDRVSRHLFLIQQMANHVRLRNRKGNPNFGTVIYSNRAPIIDTHTTTSTTKRQLKKGKFGSPQYYPKQLKLPSMGNGRLASQDANPNSQNQDGFSPLYQSPKTRLVLGKGTKLRSKGRQSTQAKAYFGSSSDEDHPPAHLPMKAFTPRIGKAKKAIVAKSHGFSKKGHMEGFEKANQDSFMITEFSVHSAQAQLYAVADGHGTFRRLISRHERRRCFLESSKFFRRLLEKRLEPSGRGRSQRREHQKGAQRELPSRLEIPKGVRY